MHETYIEYLLRKIESIVTEYTTISVEDKIDYVLFYVEKLIGEIVREPE